MEHKNDQSSLINQYIEGALDTKEQEAFQKSLEQDDSLQEETNLHLALRANYELTQKQRFKQLAQEQQLKATPPPKLKVVSRQLIYKLAAAAALIGVLMFYFLMPQPSTNPTILADNYLSTQFPQPVAIKGSQAAETHWQKAIETYRAANFGQAVEHINQTIAQGNPTAEHYFFLGLSHLYHQPAKAKEAITAFEAKNTLNANAYAAETQWFKALAYIKSGDYATAKNTLRNIADTKAWNHEKATQLLDTIE